MATVAEGDQVGGVVGAAGGAGDQVVDVGFAFGAFLTASSAGVRVAGEDEGTDGAPLIKLCSGGRKRHSVQLGNPTATGAINID